MKLYYTLPVGKCGCDASHGVAEPEQQEANYNRPNCRNKSTASFRKSELTIMSESKMPSAYNGYGNGANQCMLIVNIPKGDGKYKNTGKQKVM